MVANDQNKKMVTDPQNSRSLQKDALFYFSISQRTIELWVNQRMARVCRLVGRVFFGQFELDEDILGSRISKI